jgi:eukaryotic-like serine/threonine-protein kinase
MKSKKYLLLISFVLLTIFISGCSSSAGVSTSWHGLTASADTVYLSAGPQVYALDVKTGSEVWRYPDKPNAKGFYANPVLTPDGQLLVPSYDKVLYSLDPKTKTLKWSSVSLGNHLVGSPYVTNNMIYQPSSDGYIYAMNMTGSIVWKKETKGPLWAQPTSSPDCGCIYVASMDHTVYSYNASTGDLLWQSPELGGSLVGTPAVSTDGVLYVGTFGNELIALDAANGSIKWRFGTQDWVWAGPVLANNTLYFGDLSGFFYAVNAQDGTSLWRIQPQNSIVDKPVVLEDKIYLTTEGDTLFIISTDGNIVTSRVIGGLIYGSPLITGDTILVAPTNFDSLLVALNMDANQKWTFTPAKK